MPFPDLPPAWRPLLQDVFDGPEMAELRRFLAAEQAARKTIYPDPADWFRALELTAPADVRVVILGQDPYHGPGQAHGLCFSVRPGTKPPPSLVNIYKELASDCGIPPARHGFLESWARQGVLLLNSVLTVEAGRAASHQKRGWEVFTDAVVRAVAAQRLPVVFLLWGAYAQRKAAFAAHNGRHLILRSPHPSPLSAHSGWFGSHPFTKTNIFLSDHRRGTISWELPTA